MPYPYLKQGDQLPAVGVLQKLLTRTGFKVAADGKFSGATHQAVCDFQKQRGLPVNGEVGKDTWLRLAAGERTLQILDCVDVFDPELMAMEVSDLIAAGGNPIVIGGMSGGVEQAIHEICRRAARGSVFLLRFHGHGTAGRVALSRGKGDEMGVGHHTDLTAAVPEIHKSEFTRLRQIFGPYGCVQFMHCSAGEGKEGQQFLLAIANALGVPASGGKAVQIGGGIDTFRFEGAVRTVLPYSRTLRSWCYLLPEFPPMTVA